MFWLTPLLWQVFWLSTPFLWQVFCLSTPFLWQVTGVLILYTFFWSGARCLDSLHLFFVRCQVFWLSNTFSVTGAECFDSLHLFCHRCKPWTCLSPFQWQVTGVLTLYTFSVTGDRCFDSLHLFFVRCQVSWLSTPFLWQVQCILTLYTFSVTGASPEHVSLRQQRDDQRTGREAGPDTEGPEEQRTGSLRASGTSWRHQVTASSLTYLLTYILLKVLRIAACFRNVLTTPGNGIFSYLLPYLHLA